MAFYIDVKFLNIVSCRLEGFTQKNAEQWACRCPFCGDSQKKKSKKRGFFYKKANDMFFRCFNCEKSTTFFKFLQFIDGDLAKEYQMERFTSGETKQQNYKKPEFKFKKPVFNKKVKLNIPTISELNDDHIAKKYVIGRKIPKGSYKDLYYAEDFKKFVLETKPDVDSNSLVDNDPRLIIPFRNESGDLFAFQGRALGNNPLRYVTIKLDDSLKLFGLDRVNRKEKILVVEGPIDSLFLKNSIATADANLMVAEYLGKENLVLISDNEPRNNNIVKQILKCIKNGFNVCLLPESFPGKDINEAVLRGMSKPQILRIIEENTFNGLRAEMEFNRWRKC